MLEEIGLPDIKFGFGATETALLGLLGLIIRLCYGKIASLEKSVDGIQKGIGQLQERREDDTKALVSTLHEITLTLHKIGSQIEVQTKLTEKFIDRVDRRD